MSIFFALLLLPFKFTLLVWGANVFYNSQLSSSINFIIDSRIFSLLLISLGVTALESASKLISIIKVYPDIPVGSILECNFANLTFCLRIASMMASFKCSKDMANLELPLLVILDILFVSFECIIFLITLIGNVYYPFLEKGRNVQY